MQHRDLHTHVLRVALAIPVLIFTIVATANAQALPAGWTSSDIGSPVLQGRTTFSSGTFSVVGAGANIFATSDQFQFGYQQQSGDLDLVARLTTLLDADIWAKAGIMIRSSLDAGSAHASVYITPEDDILLQSRPSTGAQSSTVASSAGEVPLWLKLARRGSTVTAFRSTNGTSWTTIGQVTLALPSTFYVGLAVTSRDVGSLSTATFDNVTIQPASSTGNQPPTINLTSPAIGATYVAPANIALAATASDGDGTIARVDFYAGATLLATQFLSPHTFTWNGVAAGSYVITAVARDNDGATTTSDARTVTVWPTSSNQSPVVSLTGPAPGAVYTAPALVAITATASDTDGTVTMVDFYAGATLIGSDATPPYSLSWNNVPAGTYSLTAVARDNDGSTTTSAARSIAVNPPNQAPTVSLTSPANGATFTAPATITVTATASDPDGTVATVEFYAGTTLIGTSATSPYSVTWNSVPTGSYSLTAVAQDNAGATTTSAAGAITVTAPGLPAEWTATDIGEPAITGSTQYANGTFTVEGAGVDVFNTSDEFRYVYQPFTGDIEITSRVVSLDHTDPWAKAGVMIRETLAANAVQTSLVVTLGPGTHFYRRLTTGGMTQPGPVGTVGAPYWVRLERRGSTVTGFQSSDGVTWTAVGTATMTTATMYLGLEVTGSDPTQAATAVFDNVTVRIPSANQVPTVSLTAPTDGAPFTAPASIGLAATASDADGTIARVDFYAGSTLVGTDSSSPYTYTWSGVPAGSYSITAVTRDNSGATTTSEARTVTVSTTSSNHSPVVSLTGPDAGTVYTAPALVAITATASDTDGTVTMVEFYAGATLIGSDATPPYSMSWNNVPAGLYTLTAVARDNGGAMSVSGARDIRVDSAALPRTAIFTASTNHTTAVDRYFLRNLSSGR